MKKRLRTRLKFLLRCEQRVRAGQDPFEVFYAQYRRSSKEKSLVLTGGDNFRIRMHLLDIATHPNPETIGEPHWYRNPYGF